LNGSQGGKQFADQDGMLVGDEDVIPVADEEPSIEMARDAPDLPFDDELPPISVLFRLFYRFYVYCFLIGGDGRWRVQTRCG
jgi:hypothetical protein